MHRKELDWLRGLMATSIMLYHYNYWMFPQNNQLFNSLLTKLGVYAVSIFFILSGLSMSLAYDEYFDNKYKILTFFIRRIFRIWPVLWVAVIISVIVPAIFRIKFYSVGTIFLNLTTLFGFFKPDAYIPSGAWSIGNEMVYYSFTPILIPAFRKNKVLGNSLFIVATFFAFYWAETKILPAQSSGNVWPYYINPFNNLYFYIAGIAIYYNFRTLEMKKNINIIGLIIAISLFIATSGNSLITGIGRVVFSVLSIAIVFLFYKTTFKLPKIFDSSMNHLAVISYSVYLFHPIIYNYGHEFFNMIFGIENKVFFYFSSVVLTLLISSLSYKYFEKPLVVLGKNISKNFYNKCMQISTKFSQSTEG